LAEWAKRDHSVKARSRGGKNGQRLGGLLDDSYTRFATDALAPRSRGHGKKNKKKQDKGKKETSGSPPKTKEGKKEEAKKPFKKPPPGVPLHTKEQEAEWMKDAVDDGKGGKIVIGKKKESQTKKPPKGPSPGEKKVKKL
jgi:hypothetical protein